MPVFDRLLPRILEAPLDRLVRRALADHVSRNPHEPPDPLYQQLVFGDPSRLHVHPTAVVKDRAHRPPVNPTRNRPRDAGSAQS